MFGNAACGSGSRPARAARTRAWRSPATARCWTWTANSTGSRTGSWETSDDYRDDDHHDAYAARRLLLAPQLVRLAVCRAGRDRRAVRLRQVPARDGRVRKRHPVREHAGGDLARLVLAPAARVDDRRGLHLAARDRLVRGPAGTGRQ